MDNNITADEARKKIKVKWWGYVHVSGTLQTKRYFSELDIQEAKESPFCKVVFGPFEVSGRDEALDKVLEKYKEWGMR